MDRVLELEDVWVVRRDAGGEDREILRGLSLDVPRGGRLCLIGPSGSGKSTVLRLVNRLADPTRGAVRFDGRSVADYPPADLRRRAAYVAQEPVWLPGSARDNLLAASALGLVDPAAARDRLGGICDLAGIEPGWLDRGEDQLSTGQRQRVMLGRALLGEPAVLLLDEPSSALDPPSARALFRQLLTLAEARDLTLVLVTHRLEDARQFGAETALLEDGRIVRRGPTRDVLASLDASWNGGEETP